MARTNIRAIVPKIKCYNNIRVPIFILPGASVFLVLQRNVAYRKQQTR
jgi:hypothetical protein